MEKRGDISKYLEKSRKRQWRQEKKKQETEYPLQKKVKPMSTSARPKTPPHGKTESFYQTKQACFDERVFSDDWPVVGLVGPYSHEIRSPLPQ
jgi:hypothetical protein